MTLFTPRNNKTPAWKEAFQIYISSYVLFIFYLCYLSSAPVSLQLSVFTALDGKVLLLSLLSTFGIYHCSKHYHFCCTHTHTHTAKQRLVKLLTSTCYCSLKKAPQNEPLINRTTQNQRMHCIFNTTKLNQDTLLYFRGPEIQISVVLEPLLKSPMAEIASTTEWYRGHTAHELKGMTQIK